MMISAPDNPYGAASVHFWMLFARRPLNIAKLHEAFDTLGAIAARDHPEMAWPTTMRMGDGQTIPFTIEALLTMRSGRHANRSSVPAEMIKELLLRWENATIKEIVAGWQGAGFQLHLAKKVRLEPKRARTEHVGSVVVSCAWKLMQKQEVCCSSSDTDQHIDQTLRTLKGMSLVGSSLELGGMLILKWKSDFELEINPDGWLINSDYYLDFGWEGNQPLVYEFFEGNFISFEQRALDENNAVDDG